MTLCVGALGAMDTPQNQPCIPYELIEWTAHKNSLINNTFVSPVGPAGGSNPDSLAAITTAVLDLDPTQGLFMDLTVAKLKRAVITLDSKLASLGGIMFDAQEILMHLTQLTTTECIDEIATLNEKAYAAAQGCESKDAVFETIKKISDWHHLCWSALIDSEAYKLGNQPYQWLRDRRLLDYTFKAAAVTKEPERKKQLLQAIQARLSRILGQTQAKEDCSRLEWILIQNGFTPLDKINLFCDQRLKELN